MSSKSRTRRMKIQREAEGYLELGMPRHALDALARLGDPAGFNPHALYLWGEALRELQRYLEALTPLMQSAEAAPENTHVWFALGWCHKRTGRLDLAIDSLQRVLATEPGEPLAHYNLACYWSLAGNKGRALKFLSKALEINPEFRSLVDDEPDFDPVRSDPEFRSLCELPEAEDPWRQKKGSPPA